jgi:hypothetical protein
VIGWNLPLRLAGWKMLRARPVRALKSLIELLKNSWKNILLGTIVIWQYYVLILRHASAEYSKDLPT